ncbi:MAG: L,D-transpeptidase [Candidatus Pacebacteria bacterium]|nr:L,D-transpeptidase [Candidatus Paceibacterota bacterium]
MSCKKSSIFSVIFWWLISSGFPGELFANEYANGVCKNNFSDDWHCVTVQAGDSWGSLFSDSQYLLKVQKLNRQNVRLRAGQQILLPSKTVAWNKLSPFAQEIMTDYKDLFVFSPQLLAWAHYLDGQLISWGPAVGGKSWCGDIRKTCRTKVGIFSFTETANVRRRSSSFPVGCVDKDSDGNIISRKQCARMPYFVRFTNQGQGIHSRTMRGRNASHGCVGVFLSDVVYISNHIRKKIGKTNHGYFTSDELIKSQQEIVFMVLPYSKVKLSMQMN